MLKKILVVILLAVATLLIYVGQQPAEFTVSREMTMKATPEVLFPFINNSKIADGWMPWKDSDPGVEMTYSGPEEGVGSKSSWNSNGQMGTGEAEVTESIPNQLVKTKLTYTKPMEMSQVAEISLTPVADGTLVRWSVNGENNFIGRLMCLFFNMDEMIGAEFNKGLSKLKSIVETGY